MHVVLRLPSYIYPALSDYIASPLVTNLTSLQPSIDITFQIVDDSVLEGPESFLFMAQVLSEGIFGIEGDFARQVDINDNDGRSENTIHLHSYLYCHNISCLNRLCAKFIQCNGR